MSTNTDNKRIARNTIFMAIRMVIVLAINLYATRLILSAIGVVDYGIYTVVCGVVAMFGFLNSAMSNGIQRFYNFEMGKVGEAGVTRVYNASLRIQFIVAFIVFVATEIVGVWYLNNKMVLPPERLSAAFWVMQYSIFSLVIIIIQVPYVSYIIAREKLDFYAMMSVGNAVLTLLATILLSYIDFDRLITYGFFLFVIHVLFFLAYLLYSKRISVNLVFERKTDYALFKEMVQFSGWNLLGTFAGVGKEQGTDVILNFFFGPIVNAARGVANQVNGGLQSLVSNLSISVRPQVTKSYAEGNINRTMNLTYSISKVSCIILYMFSLPIILEIDFILRIWLGDNIPEHTQNFVLIIVATSFLNNLNSAISGVVHSSGKMKKYQIVGSVLTLFSIPAIYIVLRLGGSPEMALCVLFVSMLIVQIGALLVLKTIVDYSIKTYLRKVLIPFLETLLVSIIFPLFILYVMEEGFLRFVVVSIISLLSVGVTTFFVGLNKSERELCMSYYYKVKAVLRVN